MAITVCPVSACADDLTISLCCRTHDTVLAVYDDTGAPLSLLACDDDACGVQSEVTIPSEFGEVYLIRIGDWSGEQGTGVMAITCSGSE